MISITVENGVVKVEEVRSESIVRKGKGKSLIRFPEEYCVLDLETTGLSARWDHIIEIAAVRYRNGEPVDRFQTLVRPPLTEYYDDDDNEYTAFVEPYISRLTGITNEMLEEAPTIKDALPQFLSFVNQSTIVGYNVSFDVNFIFDACIDELGLEFSNNYVDVLRIARKLFPEWPHHRLRDVAAYFNISNINAHRALADCITTQICYSKLKDIALQKYESIEDFENSFKTLCSKSRAEKEIVGNPNLVDPDCPFYGKQVVFTGTLERYVRKDAMQIVADLGGINGNTVTKKTNYLVLGETDYSRVKNGKSSKQKKAESLKLKGSDIEIIPESVFYEMLLKD